MSAFGRGSGRAPEVSISAIAPIDSGLASLVLLLRFHGIAANTEQLRHKLGHDRPADATEIVRLARPLDVKVRSVTARWERLRQTPLPAIAALRDGSFIVIAQAAEDRVLVQDPRENRPAVKRREELEEIWDGRLILISKRAGISSLTRRFDVTWFLGAIAKYRGVLSEVLVASFFLQMFALVSPLLFQVIIDKVLVHRGMSTLDVADDRHGGDRRVRDRARDAAHLHLLAHHEPHRRRARRAAVPPPAGAADRLFPGAPRRRFGRARARAGEHPRVPHRLGAHARPSTCSSPSCSSR